MGGYTKMVANMLAGIEVKLGVDYLAEKEVYDKMAAKVIYTGAIDAYFDFKLGALEYRSVRFETELLDKPNFQGNAAVNYTDAETPWTRIIEHKWFEFGKMMREMRSLKQSLAGNIAQNGNQEMSHIIRSMMRRTENFMLNIRNLQKLSRKLCLVVGLVSINIMIWMP